MVDNRIEEEVRIAVFNGFFQFYGSADVNVINSAKQFTGGNRISFSGIGNNIPAVILKRCLRVEKCHICRIGAANKGAACSSTRLTADLLQKSDTDRISETVFSFYMFSTVRIIRCTAGGQLTWQRVLPRTTAAAVQNIHAHVSLQNLFTMKNMRTGTML